MRDIDNNMLAQQNSSDAKYTRAILIVGNKNEKQKLFG